MELPADHRWFTWTRLRITDLKQRNVILMEKNRDRPLMKVMKSNVEFGLNRDVLQMARL